MALSYTVAARTDKGLVRPINEDYLHIDKRNNVFAVCDGMGGHQAGEVASMTASRTLELAFSHFAREIESDSGLSLGRSLPPSGTLLVKAIRLANRAVYTRSRANTGMKGMGTTIVAVAIEGDLMSLAHVGDSRAYQITGQSITPLTVDHSWISEIQQVHQLSREEASSVVGKNIITRALGVRETVEVDYRLIKVRPGDTFLLCSDGLCGYVDDEEIHAVARRMLSDMEKLADMLIQMANDRGGSDNVSVCVLQITEATESPIPELAVSTFPAETPELLASEDSWVDKLADTEDQLDAAVEAKKRHPNMAILIVIFLSFIAVTAAILYFSSKG